MSRAAAVTLFFISTLAQAQIYYPPAIRAQLAQARYWITISYSQTAQPGSFGQPILSMAVPKKWQTQFHQGRLVALREITHLSVENDSSGKLFWTSARVNLNRPIELSAYISEEYHAQRPDVSFRSLSDESFELISRTQFESRHVIFVPTQEDSPPQYPAKSVRMNVWTAPLGPYWLQLENDLRMSQPGRAYLYHNFSSPKEVVLDPSFPSTFVPAIERLINEWNEALGATLLRLHTQREQLDVSSCLVGARLCLSWYGRSDLAWTGLSASTQIAYDPISGEILGGFSRFLNHVDNRAQLSSSPEDDQRALSGTIDMNWVVRVFLQKEAFAQIKSPRPEAIVQAVMLHEVGHFLGLAHNFAGSLLGTPAQPSLSNMDYVPFPVIYNNTQVGPYDRAVLRAVYHNEPLPPNFRFCDDREAMPSTPDRPADCNAYDLGDAAAWYLALARQSPSGVFTSIPGTVMPLLSILSGFVVSSRDVDEFLCEKEQQGDHIKADLLAEHGIQLRCDGDEALSRLNATRPIPGLIPRDH